MHLTTLPDILRERLTEPPTLAYRFLADGTEQSAMDWSYHDLARRASQVAARLGDCAGRRVVLALDPGLAYIAALFGIFQAGAVAVPSFPPFGRKASNRFVSIVADCRPDAVVMASHHLQSGAMAAEPLSGVRVLTLDDADLSDQDGPAPAAADRDEPAVADRDEPAVAYRPAAPDEPALIQYTSGSTGDPKGIVLTHENLVSNCRALEANMGADPDRVGCSWLPPYHDMGLMGTIMLSLHGGWPLVLLSPVHFVQRPYRWLKAVSDHRATISVAPNFAFDLCADTVTDEELATLDLSTLRQLYCGSEPVFKATLDRFRDRFGPAGYDEECVIPCYGMAEATLFVSGKPDGTPVRTRWLGREGLEQGRVVAGAPWADDAVEVVSCGAVAEDHDVTIVDPKTLAPAPADRIGEVWVSGPNVAHGYFRRPDLTAAAFVAGPAGEGGDPTPARRLRTGDLGFLQDGELYITGRIKDLIVIAGRNLYPQDIELSALTACEWLRRAAAFGVVRPGTAAEELVVVAEVTRSALHTEDELARAAREITAAVTVDHGVAPGAVHIGPPGTVAVTTSGKVRRGAVREDYLAGRLKRPRPAATSVAP
ncbi:fatty acyl-AMP ligase [Streptomyces sp. TRM66268-LWL]|uniref:Fatty acyl-AMP ligase n=1 Tax=Streptomyces polyasparticus TaxID=2767826 RepID=A0ABR7SQ86_9ACTN|nr:fatty acyl-AMP ligase [Streptomyces polyasparticus]MBC9716498.1 fatty acyl-AMP ligase [Streptomyces polyasparticus]